MASQGCGGTTKSPGSLHHSQQEDVTAWSPSSLTPSCCTWRSPASPSQAPWQSLGRGGSVCLCPRHISIFSAANPGSACCPPH